MGDLQERQFPDVDQPVVNPDVVPLHDEHAIETSVHMTSDEVIAEMQNGSERLTLSTTLADIAVDPEAFNALPPERRDAVVRFARQMSEQGQLDGLLSKTGAKQVRDVLGIPQPKSNKPA